MRFFPRVLLALGLCLPSPASAQWQVPNNAIPYGKGSGKVGFGSAASTDATKCLIGGAPPVFGTCPTSSSAWDTTFCNTVGYIIVRLTGAWTCNQDIPRNVVWFGADKTGVSAAGTAVAAAIATLPAQGGVIYFPTGKFALSAEIAYTFSVSAFSNNQASIVFIGDGSDATILTFTAANGFNISYVGPQTSAKFRGMTLITTTDGGHKGIILTQTITTGNCLGAYTQTILSDLQIRGVQGGGGGTNYWDYGVYADGVSDIKISDTDVIGGVGTGVGYSYTGRDSPICWSTGHDLASSSATNVDTGIVFGTHVQGLHLDKFLGIAVSKGVNVVSGTGTDGLQITGSDITANTAIYVDSIMAGLTVTGNNLLGGATPAPAIQLTKQGGCTITGNSIRGSSNASSTGIQIAAASGTSPCIVVGNLIRTYATGITLTATSVSNLVSPNVFFDIGTANFSDSGTNNIVGFTGTNSVRKGDDSAACNQVFVQGQLTSSTCL